MDNTNKLQFTEKFTVTKNSVCMNNSYVPENKNSIPYQIFKNKDIAPLFRPILLSFNYNENIDFDITPEKKFTELYLRSIGSIKSLVALTYVI
jgi:hypothetical protein